MTEEDLMPCPFCGGKAYIHDRSNDFSEWHWVSCRKVDCVEQKTSRPTVEQAISAWNRRDA